PSAWSLRDELAEPAPEEALREVLCQLAERLQVAHALLTTFRVARAQRGRDHGFEQSHLAIGRGSEAAQVARRDPVAREPARDRRALRVRLGVEALAGLESRGEQAVLLELAREPCVDARSLAQRGLVELGVGLTQASAAPAAPLRRRRPVELLADYLQRQA